MVFRLIFNIRQSVITQRSWRKFSIMVDLLTLSEILMLVVLNKMLDVFLADIEIHFLCQEKLKWCLTKNIIAIWFKAYLALVLAFFWNQTVLKIFQEIFRFGLKLKILLFSLFSKIWTGLACLDFFESFFPPDKQAFRVRDYHHWVLVSKSGNRRICCVMLYVTIRLQQIIFIHCSISGLPVRVR